MAGMLCKKLIDNDLSMVSTAGMWIGIAAFALQIYFDFSAYSDMAIGLGYMLGFRFRENFNYPYTAVSISDFWRRWHISLTQFFREYVYIPMGGNRSNFVRNMLIVWLLTGFWHGASWNYLLWGMYYFVFLMLERVFLGKILDKLPKFIGWIYSMAVVLVGWVFFYFEDAVKLKYALSIMFGVVRHGVIDPIEKTVIINFLPFVIIGIIACLPVSRLVKNRLEKFSAKSRGAEIVTDALSVGFVAVNLFVSTAALVGSSYNPFLYFRF